MYVDYVVQCAVMALCKKYLRDLTKKSRHFTVKVKIIEKTRSQVSSSKIMYQRIRMEDEKVLQLFSENLSCHYIKIDKFNLIHYEYFMILMLVLRGCCWLLFVRVVKWE